jgi:hypothetical protein
VPSSSIGSSSSISSSTSSSTSSTTEGIQGCGRPGSPVCAVLRAARELNDPFGLLLVQGTRSVTIRHLVFDGNRGERLDTIASLSCGQSAVRPSTGRQPGYNMGVHSCVGCSLVGVISMNALCGTGCEWSGEDAVIEHSRYESTREYTHLVHHTHTIHHAHTILLYACTIRSFMRNGDHFGRQSGAETHKWYST